MKIDFIHNQTLLDCMNKLTHPTLLQEYSNGRLGDVSVMR